MGVPLILNVCFTLFVPLGPSARLSPNSSAHDLVGIRGPFGKSWPLLDAGGFDVVVIAGGIGLAPLRPVIHHLLGHRKCYGRIALLYGARTPEELLYWRELDQWRRTPDFQVRVTVDRAGKDWLGDVGIVTKMLSKIRVDPADTLVMMCGPEPMMRLTAQTLEDFGVDSTRTFISMERNMKCATGTCGHCQFGPHFVCKDGPVFAYHEIADILKQREI